MYLKEKRQLIKFGCELVEKNLTFNSGGNLSVFDHVNQNMIITPSGIPYENLKVEDICVLSVDGKKVDGELKPSSEYLMHLEIYKRRKDINSLIHSHSKYIGVVSALGKNLPSVHYLIASAGGKDVPLAPYATFGTMELAVNAAEYIENRKAVILSNHGLIAGGKSLKEAMDITVDLEYCSFIYITALSAGEPTILSDEEMEKMVERFKSYGQ